MHPITCILTVFLATSVLLSVECLQDATDSKGEFGDGVDRKNDMLNFSLNSFLRFESSFNETKTKNKLMLSKSYIKFAITPTDKKESPSLSIKMSRFEELMNCDNLTLSRNSRNALIDCQPLQAHFLDNNHSSVGIPEGAGKYVRRSSVWIKIKSFFGANKKEYVLYPLRSDVIQNNIEASASASNLDPSDYSRPNNLNLGYYFEIKRSISDVTCSGDIFLSVNQSETFARLLDDPIIPEYVEEIDYLIKQSQQNGYLLTLQNVECTKPDFGDILALKGEFTIAQKHHFPYLVVRHKMAFHPLDAFFKYEGRIDQVRDSKATNPSTYNTTITANLLSALFPAYSFKLNQVFVNEDEHNGHEKMNWAFSTLAFKVDSHWNEKSFIKSLVLFLTNLTNEDYDIEASINALWRAITITYNDNRATDYASIDFNYNKKWLDSVKLGLLSRFGLYNLHDSKYEKQNAKARDEL